VLVTAAPVAAQGLTERSPQGFDSSDTAPVQGAGSAFSDLAAAWSGNPVDAGGAAGSSDWSATDLAHAGSWAHGGSSGGFTYSYGMRVPPVTGPSASIGLSYSSAAHDGLTSGTNNQASWVGDGWSYSPGFIERSYASCSSEDEQSGNNGTDPTGDRCWNGKSPAVTMSLGGTNTSLVLDDDTSVWRAASDANWKIELLGSPASASNATTERWRITGTDGTQYYFAGEAADAASRWTMPVFGNNSGEPCYKSGDFKGSKCSQAYRWLLDRVVDVHGNMTRYYYVAETGRYAAGLDADNPSTYTRGGRLQRIEAGLREGSSAKAAARIEFTVADRCLSNCRDASNDPKENSWPDTPWSLHCKSGQRCEQYSPAFFNTKRLTEVTTKVLNGDTYRTVDSWKLTHEFKDYGDESQVVLWLKSVQHTGHVGGTASTPAVKFGGEFLQNRVETGNGNPGIWRPRITSIQNETGGVTTVNYSDRDCGTGNLPSSDHQNSRRCYPMRYTPENLPTQEEYFHKYVVDSIVQIDTTGSADPIWTFYDYSTSGGGTSALWAWNDAEFVDEEHRNWNQWRGYAQVTTRVGDPADSAPQLRSRTRYYRGFDGDTLPGGGTRSVSVTDSQGNTATDHRALTGMVWETASYNDTTIIDSTTTRYWTKRTAKRSYTGGKIEAWMTGASRVDSRTKLSSTAWRHTRTTTTYDNYGRATAVSSLGDLAVSGDEQCVRTTFADNTSKWIVDKPATVEAVSVDCATTPQRPRDLIGAARAYYDGASSVTAAPTKGLMTRADVLDAWNGSAQYATIATSTFDALGRPLTATDALGNTTTTTYTPVTAQPVTSMSATNALGHVSSETFDPAWGAVLTSTAPGNKTTTATYDPLGRTTAVWLPGRNPATKVPNTKFAYEVSASKPSSVTTESMIWNETYLTKIDLYDSLLRHRQSQSQTFGGRLVSQTVYDSYGRVRYSSGPVYNNDTGPRKDLVWIHDANDVSRTTFRYDGASRVTDEIFSVKGDERWRTTTVYGGHDTHWMEKVIPPQGATTNASLTNAQGQLAELRQYRNRAGTGTFDATRYTYTPDGSLETVVDPAGNTWSYEYDLRGRQVASHDPDTGTTLMSYNVASQLVSTTDDLGVVLSYSYDKLGRTTKTWEGQPDVGDLRVERTYDGAIAGIGLLSKETHWIDGQAWSTDYLWYSPTNQIYSTRTTLPSAAGPLAGRYTQGWDYHPDGSVRGYSQGRGGGLAAEDITFGYNSMGLPSRVVGTSGDLGAANVYVDQAIYSPYGQLLQRKLGDPAQVGGTRGQVWQTWLYEEGTGRLTDFYFDKDTAGPYNGTMYGVAALSYDYDQAGNILSIADAPTHVVDQLQPERQCFQYDYLRRLTEAWAQDGDSACAATPSSSVIGGPGAYWSTYTFDLVGNRTSEKRWNAGGSRTTHNYSYPSAGGDQPHALSSVTDSVTNQVTGFEYDAVGNTTAINRPGEEETYTWTAMRRLETVETDEGTTRFYDDASGKRIMRLDPDGSRTAWVAGYELRYDAANGTKEATRYYTHGGQIVGLRVEKGHVQWMSTDHHGTGQWVVNGGKLTVTARKMDPFGNQRGENLRAWPDERGFVGGIKNRGTRLTSIGAREYDSAFGRFITRDPIKDFADSQQFNGYSYANNNPVVMSDPSGLKAVNSNMHGGGSCIDGDCSYHNSDGSIRSGSECAKTGTCGRGAGSSIGGVSPAKKPDVSNRTLQNILDNVYRPGTVGDGTTGAALENELKTGDMTNGKYHFVKAVDQAGGLANLLNQHERSLANGGPGILSEADYNVAVREFDRLWKAINSEDKAGKVTENVKSGRSADQVAGKIDNIRNNYGVREFTGAQFDLRRNPDGNVSIRSAGGGRVGSIAKGLGLLEVAVIGVDVYNYGFTQATDKYMFDTVCGASILMCPMTAKDGTPIRYNGDGTFTPLVG
jgi:RHS repeat-associated protein